MDEIRLLAGVIGSVYVAAAVSKALARERVVEFAQALGVQGRGARLLPWSLVPLEAAIGAALIAGFGPPAASIAAAVTALGFVAVQGYAIRHDVRAACGCFGFDRDRPGLISTIRAATLALASLALLGLQLAAGSPSSGGMRSVALGCLIGLVSVAVFGLVQQVADFEQRRAELVEEI
jgi:uncharacterized membrane protein YphA (DoxX/SURF4 family)